MRFLFLIMFATAVFSMPARAFAQVPRPERPYRGVYGGGQAETDQSLTASVSAGGGYDTNVYVDHSARIGLGNDPRNPSTSGFGSLVGSLSYSLSRDSISLFASGSSSAQYYIQMNDGLVTEYNGSAGLAWQMSSRTRLSAAQTLGYQPLSAFAFFPEIIVIEPGDTPSPTSQELGGHFGTTRERYLTTNSNIHFSHNLSKRSSLSVSFSRGMHDYTASNFDVTENWISGRFTRSVGKGLGLHLGYGYRTADYGRGITDARKYRGRTFDVGVDYSRELSVSRRTKLTFATGTGIYRDLSDDRFLVTGNVHLNREIGRSWNASVNYNRGVDFANQLRQPIIGDSLSTGIGGLISRRVQFHAGAGASRGIVGLSHNGDYTTYTASTGISFDLSRKASFTVDYGYYNYGFDVGALILPSGVPEKLNRHTVQANVNLWLPLLRSARRPHASR